MEAIGEKLRLTHLPYTPHIHAECRSPWLDPNNFFPRSNAPHADRDGGGEHGATYITII